MDARHEHHLHTDNPGAPTGSLIWLHMLLQAGIWGVLFPLGMILGMKKSRYHVPVQTVGILLTTCVGYTLGHRHGGREYKETAHGPMALALIAVLIGQASSGIYLKLHREPLRNFVVSFHGFLGRLFPLLGLVQALFGAFTFLGYCLGEEALQCYAHWTFGASFIVYATLLSIMMSAGAEALRRKGTSQELYDSLMIMTFGIINTFSMRHSDGWSHKDMQHTALGLLWWAGGSLGVFMSLGGKRNVVPSLVFIMTGYAFGGHVQKRMISSMVHKILGYALGGAGLVRIVEICFVLYDKNSGEGPRGKGVMAWQHLYPYLLTLTGCIFLSATDEELKVMEEMNIDGVTYMLIIFSVSFLIYLLITLLITAYLSPSFGGPPSARLEPDDEELFSFSARKEPGENGYEAVQAEHFELDDAEGRRESWSGGSGTEGSPPMRAGGPSRGRRDSFEAGS